MESQNISKINANSKPDTSSPKSRELSFNLVLDEDEKKDLSFESKKIKDILHTSEFKFREMTALIEECLSVYFDINLQATGWEAKDNCAGVNFEILYQVYHESMKQAKFVLLELIKIKFEELDEMYVDEVKYFLELLEQMIDSDFLLMETMPVAKKSAKYYSNPKLFEKLVEIAREEIEVFDEIHQRLLEKRSEIQKLLEDSFSDREVVIPEPEEEPAANPMEIVESEPENDKEQEEAASETEEGSQSADDEEEEEENKEEESEADDKNEEGKKGEDKEETTEKEEVTEEPKASASDESSEELTPETPQEEAAAPAAPTAPAKKPQTKVGAALSGALNNAKELGAKGIAALSKGIGKITNSKAFNDMTSILTKSLTPPKPQAPPKQKPKAKPKKEAIQQKQPPKQPEEVPQEEPAKEAGEEEGEEPEEEAE